MNRKIKFRVWCKTLAGMMSDYPLVVEDNGTISLNKIFEDDDMIFMQYTGIKDCKGKEIYEGDIVKRNHCNSLLATFIVKWERKTRGTGFNTGAVGYQMKDAEVIGNIYENPSILGLK